MNKKMKTNSKIIILYHHCLLFYRIAYGFRPLCFECKNGLLKLTRYFLDESNQNKNFKIVKYLDYMFVNGKKTKLLNRF